MQRIEEGNETNVFVDDNDHFDTLCTHMIYIMIIYQGKVPTSYQTGNG